MTAVETGASLARPLPRALLPAENWLSRPWTQIGGALDAMVLRAMRAVVDATLMPAPEDLGAVRASAAPFLDGRLLREPADFFRFASEPGEAVPTRSRWRRSLSGGAVVQRAFRLAYRGHAGEAPAEDVHDRLLVEHWVHEPRRPRGTLIALHGFTMGQPRIDAVALFATQWFGEGLDVALVTLPYHGRRTPKDARFSGERFAAPNVERLAEAVRRAVYEIRFLVTWVRERTDAPVGLLGLSLGGYLSALVAGLYDDLDFVVPMVPPVCIGDLAWRFFQNSRRHRPGDATAFTHEELRTAYRVHSPLTFALRVPPERALIVAGRGDRIVPPEHPYALWRHWGEPKIHWFSGSHLAPFGRQRIFDAGRRHLRELGIL
jgi:hypothetical protein